MPWPVQSSEGVVARLSERSAAGRGRGGVAAAPARRTELQNPTGFFSFFGLAFLVARLNLSPLTQSLSPVTTASGGLGGESRTL